MNGKKYFLDCATFTALSRKSPFQNNQAILNEKQLLTLEKTVFSANDTKKTW
jgi:hypothetical protein